MGRNCERRSVRRPNFLGEESRCRSKIPHLFLARPRYGIRPGKIEGRDLVAQQRPATEVVQNAVDIVPPPSLPPTPSLPREETNASRLPDPTFRRLPVMKEMGQLACVQPPLPRRYHAQIISAYPRCIDESPTLWSFPPASSSGISGEFLSSAMDSSTVLSSESAPKASMCEFASCELVRSGRRALLGVIIALLSVD